MKQISHILLIVVLISLAVGNDEVIDNEDEDENVVTEKATNENEGNADEQTTSDITKEAEENVIERDSKKPIQDEEYKTSEQKNNGENNPGKHSESKSDNSQLQYNVIKENGDIKTGDSLHKSQVLQDNQQQQESQQEQDILHQHQQMHEQQHREQLENLHNRHEHIQNQDTQTEKVTVEIQPQEKTYTTTKQGSEQKYDQLHQQIHREQLEKHSKIHEEIHQKIHEQKQKEQLEKQELNIPDLMKEPASPTIIEKTPSSTSNERPPKVEKENEEATKFYDEAKSYMTGEARDFKRAYRLLLAAAELNHTKAMENLAYPLLFGDHIKRNESKSYQFLHKLAEKGSPMGQQGLAFIYGAGINANSSQAKALVYVTFAALGGNTLAEIMLGYRYHSGIGVGRSCESALTYYKKAAKKVSDLAMASLGSGITVQRVRLYDELEQPGGNGGQIDEDLLQYYQYLADKGDTQAQIGLGQLYFQGGRGVEINFEKAFFYFNLASETGNANAKAYLGKMYLQGLHVKKDTKIALDFFTTAVNNNNAVGQAGLGLMYLKGDGVTKDYSKALKYFTQSAEQGWVEGQLQLGNMYHNGIGVKKDFRQAVKYFTFASQSGHVLAFYNLGLMHSRGTGVMRSCRTATELLKNVAERGKWSSMFMDAYDAYKRGDVKTALLKYYFLAELGYEVAQSNVAYILDKDEGTFFDRNQTYARALLQWSRAADQGYSIARVKQGDYYFYGLGTKVDYEAAALQYRLASDQQNNAQAMFNLGYMHEQGFGLKKDIHLAKRFYDMAAEASVDAQFPVYLALAKLGLNFAFDWLKKNYRFWERIKVDKIKLYVMQNAGPDWDIYLISILAGILCILILFRRGLGH